MMKIIAVVLLLVAVASANFYCPDSVDHFECSDAINYPHAVHNAYCLKDGNWVCGKCAVKEAYCFGGLSEASSTSACTGPKPSC